MTCIQQEVYYSSVQDGLPETRSCQPSDYTTGFVGWHIFGSILISSNVAIGCIDILHYFHKHLKTT